MIEFLKNIKSKIGIYHLEDDAISIGKILKISGKYLFLDSYDSNNKKEGIKVFLISLNCNINCDILPNFLKANFV